MAGSIIVVYILNPLLLTKWIGNDLKSYWVHACCVFQRHIWSSIHHHSLTYKKGPSDLLMTKKTKSKRWTPVQGIEPWAPRYLFSQVMRARNVSHYTIPDANSYNKTLKLCFNRDRRRALQAKTTIVIIPVPFPSHGEHVQKLLLWWEALSFV